MWTKFDFILNESARRGIPVIIAGDLGHFPYWPNWLLTETLWRFRRAARMVYLIPGQHDLPHHRLDNWGKAALGTLDAGRGNFQLILGPDKPTEIPGATVVGFPYGCLLDHMTSHSSGGGAARIAVAHCMVIEDKPLWPGQEAPRGHELLRKYPEYDVILTGDNHHPFVAEDRGRVLVNPGGMLRMNRDQADHRPRVYVVGWGRKGVEVEEVYLPIETDVFVDEKIPPGVEMDSRIEAFVARVKDGSGGVSLSFRENLNRTLATPSITPGVKSKVIQAVETPEGKRG
jgi:DNA repair exonuclease SbcCD nuclease subunit